MMDKEDNDQDVESDPMINDNLHSSNHNSFDDHHWITLTIAHLKIALLGGNSEVGNSEYINHQNCPPQLLCIFSVNMAIG